MLPADRRGACCPQNQVCCPGGETLRANDLEDCDPAQLATSPKLIPRGRKPAVKNKQRRR